MTLAESSMPLWAYLSIVNVMVECRARVWASLGVAPDRTTFVMKVCLSEWKSTTRSALSRQRRKSDPSRRDRSVSLPASATHAARASAMSSLRITPPS
jgi:hypothetical protein